MVPVGERPPMRGSGQGGIVYSIELQGLVLDLLPDTPYNARHHAIGCDSANTRPLPVSGFDKNGPKIVFSNAHAQFAP